MYVLGMGIVSACGIGTGEFERALREGRPTPSFKGDGRPVLEVDLGPLKGAGVLKGARRADKLSRMALIAASEALQTSVGGVSASDIGVIVATGLGPHVTTFGFLDDVLHYGDAGVSPTVFSNSVHNAAASYVSGAFGIQGPTLTVTRFFHPFESALQLASSWLKEGRVRRVLVGAVEQYGEVLGYVCDNMLNIAKDGLIRPFKISPSYAVPGEGAAFFLLGPADTADIKEGAYCRVSDIMTGRDLKGLPSDLNVIAADGLLKDESAYASYLSPDIPTAAYSPLYGSMMSGGAFNLAAAALMLKSQTVFAGPVTENPHGLNVIARTTPAALSSASCLRVNCDGAKMLIYLTAD